MRAIALFAVLALLLAGCSGNGDAKKDQFGDAFVDTPDASSGKGLIRGIVLTPAVVPVKGASIQVTGIAEAQISDENGAFVFLDLEPGTYFLQVSKLGWTSIQQSTDVVADVQEPNIVKVAIEKLPGQDPRVITLQIDGFIHCSVGLPVTWYDCPTEEQHSNLYFDVEGTPTWVQTELLWDSTQPSGDWLYVINAFCSCDGGVSETDGARFNETAEATNPHISRADQEFLETWEVGSAEAKQLVIAVSASGPEPDTTNGSGAAVNQAFSAYATFFYNIEPDPAWTFEEDGPYPIPTEG